jgi:hypothetical protein
LSFFENYVGGVEGLAEWIRSDAEGVLHRWFYGYLEEVLRSEGIDPQVALKIPGVREALEEAWGRIRVDAVDYVLGRFTDYIVRRYGLEGVADRYLLCWTGVGLHCRLVRERVLEDFREAAVLPFRNIMEDIIDNLLDLILYSIAESERV